MNWLDYVYGAYTRALLSSSTQYRIYSPVSYIALDTNLVYSRQFNYVALQKDINISIFSPADHVMDKIWNKITLGGFVERFNNITEPFPHTTYQSTLLQSISEMNINIHIINIFMWNIELIDFSYNFSLIIFFIFT